MENSFDIVAKNGMSKQHSALSNESFDL